MKAASLSELKSELKNLPPQRLMELCVHFARFRKENKELLTYLLFEEQDEATYITSIKEFINENFKEVNRYNLYQAKKTIRKILRETNKFIRYSGKKQTEVELLLYFCSKLNTSGIKFRSNVTLTTLYNRQLLKIGKAITQLHEDLQYDFMQELKPLLD